MSSQPAGSGSIPPEQRNAIGLSFGNSNSSIAYTTSEGKAEVIANEEGDRQIPSMLAYVDGDEYHGTQAKSHLVRNARNTVGYFRDFLGRKFESIDPTHSHASAHPHAHDGTVAFTVQKAESGDELPVTVSEITTRNLKRLRSSASDFLGKDINAAVITVPTDFTDGQKESLIKAAKEAQIEVLQLVHEPVAAVLAYDARPEAKIVDKVVLVADLGGTRSDVAVIASRGGMYSVIATAHDYSLGGAQLDQVLVDFFAKEFMKKHKTDPRQNERSLAKLKQESEAVKKALSRGATANFSVESLADGVDFTTTINRTRYELLAGKTFGGFTRLIESAVKKSGLDILDINEVILSGGTSNTPRIARNLQSVFLESTSILSPSTNTTALNPSELSARGAAIQASLIQEYEAEDIEQASHPMVTVTPHVSKAIGVVLRGSSESEENFRPLLDIETPLPAKRTATYDAPTSGGDVFVRICQAEREIKVTKPEPKPKVNGDTKKKGDDDDSSIDSDDDEDEEEQEILTHVWKIGTILAEVAVRNVKPESEQTVSGSSDTKDKKSRKKTEKRPGQIEVMANVAVDLSVQVSARELGAKGGVRGGIEKPAVTENGTA